MTLSLHQDDKTLPPEALGCVLAVGSFDGVHLGHRALIAAAKAVADELGAPLGVMTFEPHPREFFRPNDPPFRLTLLPAKVRIFDSLGVDHLFSLTFDADFAGLSAEDFISLVLEKNLHARHVVTGDDFSFGRGRTGTPDLLKKMGNFGVTLIPSSCCDDGERFSSTRIRALIADAQMRAAADMLGYAWEMEAPVIHGDARGRTIGFPTANQDVTRYVRLPFGVYAVRVMIEGETVWRDGVANFGIRPMFEVKQPLLETYIFDFSAEIYGKKMRVRPVGFIRSEMRLNGLAALKSQINLDCLAALSMLKSDTL